MIFSILKLLENSILSKSPQIMQINIQIYHIFDRFMYINEHILYKIDKIHYLYVINVFSISFPNSMMITG